MRNGKRFHLKIKSLIDGDQAYVKSWQKKQQARALELNFTKKTTAKEKAHCYEVSLTNRSDAKVPPLEVRYELYKSSSEKSIHGTTITSAGSGALKMKAIPRSGTGSRSTKSVAVSENQARAGGSSDVTEESLCGISIGIYQDGELVRSERHGMVPEEEEDAAVDEEVAQE